VDAIEVDNASELRRSTAVVYHSDRRALSTVRLRRAGQLATADTCSARVISFRAILYGATENARHEFAAPYCMGGKCGKS